MRAGTWLLALAGGGIVLGSMLASFAEPVMKDAPPSSLGSFGGTAVAAAEPRPYIEAMPEDLSPPPGGYAPAFAYSEMAEWPADLAEPLPAFLDDSPASWAAPREPEVSLAEAPETSVERVPVAVEAAASAAEVAVAEARQAIPAPAVPTQKAPLTPLY